MTKRGKILRDPYAGPGLLMVQGQQHFFRLEGVWKSEVPAKPGLAVDVEFGQNATITGITAVPESQLAKEQAELALAAARRNGRALFGQLAATAGMSNLVAGAVLVISWRWLTAASLQLPFGKIEFTFWQILGFLNSGHIIDVMEGSGQPGAGIYGLFALIALAGPFVHHFWKDKRAVLGGLLPLVFMIIIGAMAPSGIASALGAGASPYEDLQKQAQAEMMNAISFGMGTYLSALASLYFAAIAARNYMVAKGTEGEILQKPQKAAA